MVGAGGKGNWDLVIVSTGKQGGSFLEAKSKEGLCGVRRDGKEEAVKEKVTMSFATLT